MLTEQGISILAQDSQEALKKVLDFVERWNKNDKEVEVAHAHHFLEGLLEDNEVVEKNWWNCDTCGTNNHKVIKFCQECTRGRDGGTLK